MRNNPSRLAIFFVAITIFRVATFAVFGLQIGWMGYAFAVGLAVGVYLTAYFIRFEESRIPAAIGLAIFLLADMWFNEFENIRTVSTMVLISDEANFLGLDASSIRTGMQVSALIFGAFPTVAAALLGWLQSGAERVKVLRQRTWFGKIGVAFAARIENAFPVVEDVASRPAATQAANSEISGYLPQENQGIVRKIRWEEIPVAERDEFPALSDSEIVHRYGGSVRRARMWRQWVREGKQPAYIDQNQ